VAQSGLVVSQVDDVTTVSFRAASRLDTATIENIANELYALVDRQARRKILLNFSAVQFCSSQMLSVLLNLDRKASAIGGRIVICRMKSDLKKVFKTMKLEKVLNFAASEAQAVSLLNAVGRE